MIRVLEVDDLAWNCPDDWLSWSSSGEIPPASTIIGQQRAVEAIDFGLAMPGIGYNIFVTGLSGTGRLTTIKQFLEHIDGDPTVPNDVCFVHNFRNPEEPCAVFLEAGAGRRLRDGMERLVDELAESLPKLLSDKEFRQRMERAVGGFQRREREMVEAFDREVREAGFSMVQIQAGPITRPEIMPIIGDTPVPIDELQPLIDAGTIEEGKATTLKDAHRRLSERLQDVLDGVGAIRHEAQMELDKVRRQLLRPIFDNAVRRVLVDVTDERAKPYLDAVRQDLEESFEVFISDDAEPGVDRFLRWRVNLAVDNSDLEGRPVVMETEPTYTNLFGTIERTLLPSGETTTSFMRIRAGSIMRANGGYLVVNAEDVLMEPRVWPGLKRALRFKRVQVQAWESVMLGAAVLKPQPVPLDVKVLVIGDRYIYDLLYRRDPDFPKIFKVLADFDSVMERTRDHAEEILSVLQKVAREEGLLPMDRSGMAAMLEQAVHIGSWRRRFSSRFSDLADLQREADFQARRDAADSIEDRHVIAAEKARARRHGLTEDRSHELIADGVVKVATEGVAIGEVNGLAVYDLGHHRFGKPSRITARVGLGRQGVINIERQAGLSGPTHDKGVSILTGFLRGTFSRRVPLTMACSVTFEQSYGGVDGDSASSTEVYAILSALAEIPLRQSIAVTGSVDQHGRIQAIGGVNEKIEGFFRVCSVHGLTGDQGVMIPSSNVLDLHLADEVVEAVRGGRFTIWAIDTVEDGIELLSGIEAGGWSDEEGWSQGSVFGRCQQRLEEMERLMRRSTGSGAGAADRAEPGSPGENGNGGDPRGSGDRAHRNRECRGFTSSSG
ncbi:MAG: AAA family ATPase [Thermoanaerobaculales bacterium]|jgi:predicted ATP-dependent protease|nr:AAA family ATPase [Thermoanaerobaculales bacterium]